MNNTHAKIIYRPPKINEKYVTITKIFNDKGEKFESIYKRNLSKKELIDHDFTSVNINDMINNKKQYEYLTSDKYKAPKKLEHSTSFYQSITDEKNKFNTIVVGKEEFPKLEKNKSSIDLINNKLKEVINNNSQNSKFQTINFNSTSYKELPKLEKKLVKDISQLQTNNENKVHKLKCLIKYISKL